MQASGMNSMQRVLTTLSHQEPDRVPLFLLLSLHGARHLGVSIKDYFSNPEHVFQAQMQMMERYHYDCLNGFYYGPIEVEAWGGKVIFRSDGPPNSGLPFIRSPRDIDTLASPDVSNNGVLQRVLQTISLMKQEVGANVPIMGVAMSPFSLPVMQMGFGNYLELIYEDEKRFWKLMEINTRFCVDWSNAQLAAGATFICYFDPVSSPTIIPPELYRETGFGIARKTIAQINGPTATHLASGASLPISEELTHTGTAVVGVSSEEDMAELKAAYRNKLTIVGNLNGIAMRHWTEDQTRNQVLTAIRKGAVGGGFILADNHGEIPWQVPESTLDVISRTLMECGTYPISI